MGHMDLAVTVEENRYYPAYAGRAEGKNIIAGNVHLQPAFQSLNQLFKVYIRVTLLRRIQVYIKVPFFFSATYRNDLHSVEQRSITIQPLLHGTKDGLYIIKQIIFA